MRFAWARSTSPGGRFDSRPISLFVIVALLIGTAAALLNPAFGGYDESDHFLRAWQISDGDFVSRVGAGTHGESTHGGLMPAHLLTDIFVLKAAGESSSGKAARAFKYLGSDAPAGHRVFIQFPATASYSPMTYLGAAAGIRASRWLHLSTLATLWVARLFGLALYVAIAARALHHMRRRRWLLASLAIAPVTVLQASTISADGITLALSLLAIAYTLRIVTLDATEALPRNLAAEGFVIAIALGLAKPPYILFLLLLALVLLRRGAQRRRRVWAGLVMGPGFVASAVWNLYAQGVYTAPERIRNVDSGRQLRFIASHPLRFAQAIGSTITGDGLRISHEMLLSTSSWMPPSAFVAVMTGALVIALIVGIGRPTGHDHESDTALGLTMAVIALGTAFLVVVLAYAGWNPVGASRVNELQGRYLYPSLALIVLALGLRAKRALVNDFLPFGVVASVSLFTVAGLVIHFYV